MHRMRRLVAKAGLTLVLAAPLGLGSPAPARADLIRPGATQSFPDLAGDIVGTQSYTYDPATRSGTFEVNNTPILLAVGPQASSEFFITDTKDTIRNQSLQIKLDPSGNLVNDPNNSFALYGSVTINGQSFDGLLLQGKPTEFGWRPQDGGSTMSVYDVNMTLTGGKLKELFGPDAYVSIITETNSTFDGNFTRNFSGLKAVTNVRAYNAPPLPVPEPTTLSVFLACLGAGLFYRHRRRVALLVVPTPTEIEE